MTEVVNIIYTECLKLMYTLFETLLWKNKMRQKYNFCYVHSLNLNLNLPKPEHVQNVPRLPQYTPNNDDEQSDILSGLLLMERHRWHVQSELSDPPVFVVLWHTLCSSKFPTDRNREGLS